MKWKQSFGTVAMLGVAVASCGPEEHPAGAPAAETSGAVVPVLDTLVPDILSAVGVAEPVRQAALSTKLLAQVVEVLVREGEPVGTGQVLARLDTRELDAKRRQVEAGLEAATASQREALTHARRIRALYQDSAAPLAQLDQADAGLARADAAVTAARAAAAELDALGDYAVLRAPFAGTVTQRLVDPGSFAAPGVPLLQLQDQGRLRIAVAVAPEAAYPVQPGRSLRGTVAGQPVTAVVEGVAPAPGGNLVLINALVDNGDGRFFAGSPATLDLPGRLRPVVAVPSAALVREGDLVGVYLRRDGRTDLRWVRVGRTLDGWVEVVAGLAPGDGVVVGSADAGW